MKFKSQIKNIVILIFIASIIGTIFYIPAEQPESIQAINNVVAKNKIPEVNDIRATSNIESAPSRPPIGYDQTTADKLGTLLHTSPDDSPAAKSAMKFFNSWMEDPAFSTFFYKTYDFFGDVPEAYPAARFVSLTLLFDESPDNFYLMQWTQGELSQFSNEIMSTLEEKRDQIDVNPYFHNRMLNLANQLEVAPERKLAFFGDTIRRPIVLENNGDLDDSSHNFEIALLLASNIDSAGNEVAPYVSQLLDTNPSAAEFSAIRERVLTFFPALGWLFDGQGNSKY